MAYIPFYNICQEIAEKETRVITLQHNDNEFNLPKGDYAFIELFCDECDCRRVFLQVVMNQKIVTTIAYGWEKLSYYRKEFKGFEEKEIKEIKGPSIDSFLHQSNISNQVFEMFHMLLFSNKEYMNQITKHYYQFKEALNARSDL